MTSRPVLVYTLLRLLAFIVPLGILLFLFPGMPWLAALLAAAIGASLSILFLRRPLAGVSTRIHDARQGARVGDSAAADAAAEDAAVEDAAIEDAARDER